MALDAETVPDDMRGYLEIEDEELKFFTRRFFILVRDPGILDYYKEDPLVQTYIHCLLMDSTFFSFRRILFLEY